MMGWRCPSCGRCHSPSIVTCPYCVATPVPWPPLYPTYTGPRPTWVNGTPARYIPSG